MDIRTHERGWGVFAEFLGAERVVFSGSLFACIAWRRKELARLTTQ